MDWSQGIETNFWSMKHSHNMIRPPHTHTHILVLPNNCRGSNLAVNGSGTPLRSSNNLIRGVMTSLVVPLPLVEEDRMSQRSFFHTAQNVFITIPLVRGSRSARVIRSRIWIFRVWFIQIHRSTRFWMYYTVETCFLGCPCIRSSEIPKNERSNVYTVYVQLSLYRQMN